MKNLLMFLALTSSATLATRYYMKTASPHGAGVVAPATIPTAVSAAAPASPSNPADPADPAAAVDVPYYVNDKVYYYRQQGRYYYSEYGNRFFVVSLPAGGHRWTVSDGRPPRHAAGGSLGYGHASGGSPQYGRADGEAPQYGHATGGSLGYGHAAGGSLGYGHAAGGSPPSALHQPPRSLSSSSGVAADRSSLSPLHQHQSLTIPQSERNSLIPSRPAVTQLNPSPSGTAPMADHRHYGGGPAAAQQQPRATTPQQPRATTPQQPRAMPQQPRAMPQQQPRAMPQQPRAMPQ